MSRCTLQRCQWDMLVVLDSLTDKSLLSLNERVLLKLMITRVLSVEQI